MGAKTSYAVIMKTYHRKTLVQSFISGWLGSAMLLLALAMPKGSATSVNAELKILVPISVVVTGRGTVSGVTNGQWVAIGQKVTPTATPGAGYVLTNWLVTVDGVTVLSTNRVAPFLMQPDLVLTAAFADVTKPAVTVLSPTAAASRLTNGLVTVQVRATDNVAVENVEFYLNGQDFGPGAPLKATNLWSRDFALAVGTNVVAVVAKDSAGNVSTTDSIQLVYVNQLTNANAITLWENLVMMVFPGPPFLITNMVQDTGILNAALKVPALQLLSANSWSNLSLSLSFGYFSFSGSLSDAEVLTTNMAVFEFTDANDSAGSPDCDEQLTVKRSGSTLIVNVRAGNSSDLTRPLSLIAGSFYPLFPYPMEPVFSQTPTFALTLQDGDSLETYAVMTNLVYVTPTYRGGVLEVTGAADFTPPSIAITEPVNGQRWNNSVFNVKGTAHDNEQVSSVWVQINATGWQLAASTNHWTNWTAGLALALGTNLVQAYAVDASGNSSPTKSVQVSYLPALSAEFTFITNADNSLMVSGYTGPGGKLAIPGLVNGRTVSGIGDNAFYGNTNVTSVSLSRNITSIGNFSFYGCINLTSIRLPFTVTNLGDEAFGNCARLASVNLPQRLIAIGEGAFAGCAEFTRVEIPKDTASIGAGAFASCSSLKAINVNVLNTNFSSVEGVLFNANRSTLIEYPPGKADSVYAIPLSVANLGASAFDSCANLVSITIPDHVTNIGSSVFAYCTRLAGLTIPSGVTSLGSAAFYHCASLTRVDLSDHVTRLGNDTFAYCTSLRGITIPDSVTKIGTYTFYHCASLTNVVWSGNITTFGDYTFADCTSLPQVTIPDSVVNMGNDTFYQCSSLTNVSLSANVRAIGNYAFADCGNLTGCVIPDRVITIGAYAFAYCTNLGSVAISGSVTSIGSDAFEYCAGLAGITIPESVTSLGSYAFYRCTALTNVNLAADITGIGAEAFYDCTNLVSVVIPASVTGIGNHAFGNCPSLTGIWFLGNAPRTSSSAFGGDTVATAYCYPGRSGWRSNLAGLPVVALDPLAALSNYTWTVNNDAVTITGYGGTDLVVMIPDAIAGWPVTAIGTGAFSNCTSLESVVMPTNVSSIGDFAFCACPNLASLAISSQVTNIGVGVVGGCASLTTILVIATMRSTAAWAGSCLTKPVTHCCNIQAGTMAAM